MRRVVMVALVMLAACGKKRAAEEGAAEEAMPPAQVTCVAARAGTVSEAVIVRGVVAAPPEKQAEVASQVAGRLLEVRVREGDVVKAGALLAVVDDAALAADSVQAGAAVAAAEAGLANAKAQLARAERLFDQGVGSRREVEEARARAASAQAEVDAARAGSRLAGEQRGRARIKAPIGGTVLRVLRRPGELVDGTPATPIVEIADVRELELAGDVPAAALVAVAEGAQAEVVLDALPGAKIDATVTRVAPAVDPATGLGKLRVGLRGAAEIMAKVRPGLAGEGTIAGAQHDGVLVPAKALRRSSRGVDEVVVCADDKGEKKAEVRAVELGAHAGDDVEVIEGVRAGEAVVAEHALGIDDGTVLVDDGKKP